MEIELTQDELYDAYLEQKRIFTRDDFEAAFEIYGDDYEGIKEEFCEENNRNL